MAASSLTAREIGRPRRLDRRVLCLLAALAAALAGVACATGAARLGADPLLSPLDGRAEEHVSATRDAAVTSFLASKGINAALSLIKSAEIGAGAFVSGSINPAEVLDPMDRLVDQFATVALAASAGAVALDLVLRIARDWAFEALAAAGLFLLAVHFLVRAALPGRFPALRRAALGFCAAAVVLRIALPAALALSGVVSDRVLGAPFEAAATRMAALDDAIAPPVTQGMDALFRYARDLEIAAISEKLDGLFDDLVTVVSIFLLRVVALPLAIGWGLQRALRTLMGGAMRPSARPG